MPGPGTAMGPDGAASLPPADPAAAAAPATAAPPLVAPAVTHYENFPVASLLCPPHLRAPIAAIYAFARTADDLADEGDATADQRLADLIEYRVELQAVADGQPPQPRWQAVFGPLQAVIVQHQLPVPLLDDLLDAFMQDVAMTRDGATYANRTDLRDYCRRSANPVGRLLLHLYQVDDEASLQQSDDICTALQLINFWQDLSVDLPRGRHYLTDADCTGLRVDREDLSQMRRSTRTDLLIMDCAIWARFLMERGSPLVHRLPGRVGWELRLVVQGGLRILDKIEALQGGSLNTRPTLGPLDWLRMLARAAGMRPPAPPPGENAAP